MEKQIFTIIIILLGVWVLYDELKGKKTVSGLILNGIGVGSNASTGSRFSSGNTNGGTNTGGGGGGLR